jgi:hypothetical protein
VTLSTILNSGITAAVVGGLVGGLIGFFLQNRPAAIAAKKRHRGAVIAVLAELEGVVYVVDLMLADQAVKVLPASDVAYQAMASDLLHGLDDNALRLVVKAYTHMPLLVAAAKYAGDPSGMGNPQGILDPSLARQIDLLAGDARAAVAALTTHLNGLKSA